MHQLSCNPEATGEATGLSPPFLQCIFAFYRYEVSERHINVFLVRNALRNYLGQCSILEHSWDTYILYNTVSCAKKTEVSSDNAREESNLAAVRKNDFMAAS